MIPWLLVCELLCHTGKSLSTLVAERIRLFPCSGEINFKVIDLQAVIARIQSHYLPQSPILDSTDGLSMLFDDWRFNLRGSNTEPLLRLNVETKANEALLKQKLSEISDLIQTVI